MDQQYKFLFVELFNKQKNKKYVFTTEHRNNLSLAQKKRFENPEERKKLSLTHKGMFHTMKTKKKMSLAHIGKIVTMETRKKMSLARIGTINSVETRKKISLSKKGKSHGPHSMETRKKISIGQIGKIVSIETRKKISGVNSHFWKGGISNLRELIRTSIKSERWRKLVFKRDKYTCQDCEIIGGNLIAHHIKEFNVIFQEFLKQHSTLSPINDKEELLKLSETYISFWDITNGKTVCEKCHKLYKKNK